MERMWVASECVVERPEAFADERGTVDINRRALGVSDCLQIDVVAHQCLARTEESSHESTNDYTT